MNKYECPSCCGEGFDPEVIVSSDYPAQILCWECEGKGHIEGYVFCKHCNVQLKGASVDLNDPYLEELIERGDCGCRVLTAEDICSVQPMTGNGDIFYMTNTTGTGTASSVMIHNNGQWTITA